MKFFVLALISIAFPCIAADASKKIEADLCIYGGTPGGVACAVSAAREGFSVLLVNRHDHLGCLLTSGIGVWNSQFEGQRSQSYDEVRAAIMECNEVDVSAKNAWSAVVQYFGPKGFFHDHDARMGERLKRSTGIVRAEGLKKQRAGKLDPMAQAAAVAQAEAMESKPMTVDELAALFSNTPPMQKKVGSITRGEAVTLLFSSAK